MIAPDRWERWSAWTGILFTVLFLGLFFLPVDDPPTGATAEQLTAFYEQEGSARPIREFFLVALAAAALMWFAGTLRSALRRGEGGPGRLSAVAFGAGVAAAVLVLVAGSDFISPAATVHFTDTENFLLDPSVDEVVGSAGFISFLYSLVAGAVMIAATSLVVVRTGVFPKWFGWAGFVVAVALLLNVFYFFGFLLFLAWIVVASIILLTTKGLGAGGLSPS